MLYSMYWIEKGGIIGENSNDVQLKSIPKTAPFLAYLRFDKDAYSQHCKDYREYNTWLEERNEARYADNLKGCIGYDHKNMMHCVRLLETAIDIAKYNEVRIFRQNKDFLLQIRNGEVEYDTLLEYAESKILEMDKLFHETNLPDKPKSQEKLLKQIRLDNFSEGKYIKN